MSKKTPILRNFVSDIDKTLAKFNQDTPKSKSQQAEIDKYKHVSKLRDHATVPKKDKDIWDF